MFKNSIVTAFIVFILLIIRQAIFSDAIRWIDNIGISILVVFAYLFVEWARKPYKYKSEEKFKK